MDSQLVGAVLAAIITAGAGVYVGLSRRTSYPRQQLRDMQEEAELLALLPEGHPMREGLSKVLEARLTAYARMFDHATRQPPTPWVPLVSLLTGTVIIFVILLGEGYSALWALFGSGGRISRGGDWVYAQDDGWGYALVLTVGFLLYFTGGTTLSRRKLPWKWARAMRGDRIRPLPTRSETARAMSWLWSHVASAARWARSSLWRKDGQDPANGDPRGSGPDA